VDELRFVEEAWTSLRAFVYGPDKPTRYRSRFLKVLVNLLGVLVFVLAAASYRHVSTDGHVGSVLTILILGISLGPTILVPSRPLVAWRLNWLAAVCTGLFVHLGQGPPWPWHPTQVFALFLNVFAVPLKYPRGIAVWTYLSAVLLMVWFVLRPENNLIGVIIGVTAVALIASLIGRRNDSQRRLSEERERTALEQDRRTVLEERTRIARELHDVVAHHMSLIAVRAETAPYRIEGGMPDTIADEFAAIAAASREALTEMRRLLGVLRSETSPPIQPQPGVEDLAELVRAARDAGVEVRLEVPLTLHVPLALGLTAYRIVQEALSNARRHAAGAPVTIRLSATDGYLVVDVVNGPGTPTTAPGSDTHQGLVGMRERATMLGGSLRAGPTPDGGFAVHVTLPVDGDE
jgi:signal transduction histidine kinase